MGWKAPGIDGKSLRNTMSNSSEWRWLARFSSLFPYPVSLLGGERELGENSIDLITSFPWWSIKICIGSGVLLTCKTTQVLICFLTVYVVSLVFSTTACKLVWGRDIMPVRVLTGWHTQTRIVQGGFNRGRKVGRVSGDHRGKYSTLGVTDRQIPP